jgi:hypothetical protein
MRTSFCALLAVLPSLSAAPLKMTTVVVVLCGFAAWSPAAIVHYGNDVALSHPLEGEGMRPNYLFGSKYAVTQPIVLQKAGIIFASAITNAKVGIYTDAGGAPNTLVAETASFEVYFDGILETPLLTTPTIPAGDYWFMAVYDAVETPVGISFDDSTQAAYIAHTFNAPLPATFPAPTIYTGVAINYYLVGETTISGDYNQDDAVDAADYVVWRKTDGTPDSYNTWRSNFGRTSGSGLAMGGASNLAVPEPSGFVLLTLAVPALMLSRRRHTAYERMAISVCRTADQSKGPIR